MKFTVHKVFFAWDFEKEEKWLNKMAAKGMHLTDVGFCRYVFEEGTPGEYQYHLEWLPQLPTHPESLAYIRFIEETGAEHVGSLKKWVYFRKRVTEGAFDLFSDLDSRISHFRRVARLTGTLLVLGSAYFIALLLHLFSLGRHAPGSLVVIGVVIASFMILLGVGFYQTVKVYRRLQRQRIVHE